MVWDLLLLLSINRCLAAVACSCCPSHCSWTRGGCSMKDLPQPRCHELVLPGLECGRPNGEGVAWAGSVCLHQPPKHRHRVSSRSSDSNRGSSSSGSRGGGQYTQEGSRHRSSGQFLDLRSTHLNRRPACWRVQQQLIMQRLRRDRDPPAIPGHFQDWEWPPCRRLADGSGHPVNL